MNAFVAHLSYDFKTGIRDKSLMLMNYLFPIGFFLMIGAFMPRINPEFLQIMVPGMILFAIMSGTLLTIPFTIIGNREAGILRSFRVNGVPAGALVTIPIVAAVVHMAVASVILTVGSSTLYEAVIPTNWGWFTSVFMLAALCFATFAVLIGIVAQSSRSGTLVAQAIYVPSIMLGGLMVPEELLPEGLLAAASLLPATHAMRAFNGLAFSAEGLTAAAALPLAVLTASILVNLLLCLVLFRWDTQPLSRFRLVVAATAVAPFAVSVALV